MANAAIEQDKRRRSDQQASAEQAVHGDDAPPATTVPHTALWTLVSHARFLVAAWSSRYLFRGFFGTLFDRVSENAGHGLGAWGEKFIRFVERPGNWIQNKYPGSSRASKYALSYNAALGLGSMSLTLSYSWMVYKDMKNIFREAVGEELGKPAHDVTFHDIRKSSNQIVQRTVRNFWSKLGGRLAIDFLFLPTALLRSAPMGDFVLGAKATELFKDTWKRKTTMFEDLLNFVNHKINPRNGLGQPVTVDEMFDLFQHYAEDYHPEKMFRNVFSRNPAEIRLWAESRPIFARLAELMNQTYAYKHTETEDRSTPVPTANFALPKLIYMLGHDMIDPHQPLRTLAMIEIVNARGVAGGREASEMLARGMPPQAVMQHFALEFPKPAASPPSQGENGVIPHGSTMQLDRLHAPATARETQPAAPLLQVAVQGNARQGTLVQRTDPAVVAGAV